MKEAALWTSCSGSHAAFDDELIRGAGGGYTNTDPESRRIRVLPNEVQGRVKVKVVYVVLEAQYQASISAGGARAIGQFV